jgi:PII-like signaling protein
MNEHCLKVTTYFGERDRTEHHFLADELLDLYGRHEVKTSVLLRGISGFGLKHHRHTDQLLSLSEDLPVVSVAVDTRERIDALLPEVLEIKRRGLITLERARILSGEFSSSAVPEELGESTKLTVYVGRQERVAKAPAFQAVCDLLYRQGVSGATVLLGVDGTIRGRRERAKLFGRNADVPMMIIAVGSSGDISRVLPKLSELIEQPMLTLERVRVCKRDGELLAKPHELPGTDEHGLAIWQKLMIHTSESARYQGHALHRALVQRLRESDAAGATSLRGVWGFHGDRPPHGDKLLQVHRHVPVVTIVVDRPERISQTFSIVDEMTKETGLVTSELVPAAAAIAETHTRGGLRLSQHRL